MPIVEVQRPHFYRDGLLKAKWRRLKNNRHRCYVALKARKKFRMVPMDEDQKRDIDELLRSFGITEWSIERKINGNVTTSCGYFVFVPTDQFERRLNPLPLNLPEEILKHIRTFGSKNTLVM